MKDRFGFLIETFFDNTANQLNDLQEAINNHQVNDIISLTHAIKGSSGSVGAASMQALCKDYEDMARRGELDAATNWTKILKTEFERYKTDIQSYL